MTDKCAMQTGLPGLCAILLLVPDETWSSLMNDDTVCVFLSVHLYFRSELRSHVASPVFI